MMILHQHDNECNKSKEESKKEPYNSSAESVAVLDKLFEHFDNLNIIDEPVMSGNNGPPKNTDCNKEILNGTDSETKVYSHYSSSVTDDDDHDESDEIRDSDLQLTGEFFSEGSTLNNKLIANDVFYEYSESELHLSNVELMLDSGGEQVLEEQTKELTDFIIDYERVDISSHQYKETNDITTTSLENPRNMDDKIINALDMLRKEYSQESFGSDKGNSKTNNWEDYCTKEHDDKHNTLTKYINVENTDSSKLSDSGNSINEKFDCSSLCSENSTQTWPSTIHGNSSLDDIKFVEDNYSSVFNMSTDSDIYNQGFIEPNE
ncbi:Hypothetical protein CINCED_3A001058 [Cinara cedri]|uniref:Uncharacterized protein n=1 Tax=Cinara cedri TaxID=506608 RepID=A0A5E4MBT4_9HEMI|nr:Hypothetical protein CINCED_3A001058 [Cinara cedri]